MSRAPSIVLVHDGELRAASRVLADLGVPFAALRSAEMQRDPVWPCHLLVTSAGFADRIPALRESVGGDRSPVWVCAHDQDFLPLRERLRALGAHYLIQSSLPKNALQLFFLQLLYRGVRDRRRNPRLPVALDVRYQLGPQSGTGRLEELSRDGCRLVAEPNVTPGTPASVWLPPELSGGRTLELGGEVLASMPESERSGGPGYSVIVVFQELAALVRRQVDVILSGRALGTRVTPLGASVAGATSEQAPPALEKLLEDEFGDELELTDEDRREHPRSEYPRRLNAVIADATAVLFGRDLSMAGLRIDGHAPLKVGSSVRIALYGGAREEPLVVGAQVVCEHGDSLSLRFEGLDAAQRAWLRRLLATLPPLEALVGGHPGGERIVVSKLV